MRRLLILTAVYTGHVTEHLRRPDGALKAYPDIEVRAIDGFDLMTKVQKVCAEKTYGPHHPPAQAGVGVQLRRRHGTCASPCSAP